MLLFKGCINELRVDVVLYVILINSQTTVVLILLTNKFQKLESKIEIYRSDPISRSDIQFESKD